MVCLRPEFLFSLEIPPDPPTPNSLWVQVHQSWAQSHTDLLHYCEQIHWNLIISAQNVFFFFLPVTKPLGMRGGRRGGEGGGHCKPLSNGGPRLLQSGLRHTRGKTNTHGLCAKADGCKANVASVDENEPELGLKPIEWLTVLFTASFISVHVSAHSLTSPRERQLNHMGFKLKEYILSDAFNVKCSPPARRQRLRFPDKTVE